MRAADHQFQQALAVGVMDKKGAPGVKFDVEGSGYGFRVVRQIPAAKAQQPHSCNMQRPLIAVDPGSRRAPPSWRFQRLEARVALRAAATSRPSSITAMA